MRNIIKIVCCLLVVSFIAACSSDNRKKTVDNESKKTKHLVVTNSDALEMLLELGAGENIIGIGESKMKSFAERSKKWNLVGSWRNPNIEAIANLKPDVVVTYKKWPAPGGFDDKLKPFGITVARLNCYNLSEFSNDIKALASYTGKEARADTIISDFNRIVSLIKNHTKNITQKKKVYFEFGDFTALGVGTGSDEMLTLAGADNIAVGLKIPYPKISSEWLLKEDPDIIIKTITSDTLTNEQYNKLITRKGWNKLKALRNKQVYLISSEICTGPRAMIGTLFIAKWCSPESFASVNPDSVHIKWMQKYHGVTPKDAFVLGSKK